ncbi:hypothetical protein NE562_12860 [Butyricicoccus faecihominis]|uniref:hypothetical protein n=1 Tax=Butyricicoccus faecihominis TaxID=1712515 RepID=UPI0024791FFD|nr:hypothetical protein [Butyricicoccus faecihominis]MCQ5130556.1 hypothetical protein [Butyricicoccus faecihominis]
MKKIRKMLSLICALTLMFGGSNAFAAANEVHELVPVPPVDSEIMPFGTDYPTVSKPTYDLSSETYSYDCKEIMSTLYTDAWFKGSSTMVVKIQNYKCTSNPEFGGGSITVRVYNTHNEVVKTKTVDMALTTSATVDFSGLKAGSKYFVSFSVGGGLGYKYSFYGTISNWI